MAINWTNFQTLSDTVEAALRQTAPQTIATLKIYVDAITSAIADISEMEGTYTSEKISSLVVTDFNSYTEVLTQLSEWDVRLRDMLKIVDDIYPLIETTPPISSTGSI